MTEKEQRINRNVVRMYELKQHLDAKRYNEVIALGQKLIPETSGQNKLNVYLYLQIAYGASGKRKEALEIQQAIRKLQEK